MENSMGIDIIIPIYNAYEDLKKCIESIKKWTNLEKHRLVLVNDCSPDERIAQYLDSISSENILVIHNAKNMGFSANINKGMEQSQNRDVLLLNSDTVVTKNWLEKIQACAYSDSMIATVTPLSNNATLCSVPNFCEENKIPEGYTLDEYAQLIEDISLRSYPTIPVAHGFCMYVKREIIDIIGGFDAETFQRGYGEENDFCYRAIEMGYHHVMCDDTFILHTGTSSFLSNEKKKLIADHEKILDTRYPDLMHAVRVHCAENPTGFVSHNARFRAGLEKYKKKRKTILYLLQSDFRQGAEDSVGGTQLHVKDLTDGLKDEYNVVVVARNYGFLNVTFYAEEQEYFCQFYIGERKKFQDFRSEKMAKLYGEILDAFEVSCVHIHHTYHLTLEMFYEAKRRNIPVITTLHDFYYVCPNVKLLDENNKLCIGKECLDCRTCLKEQRGIAETVDYLAQWRKLHHEVLGMSDRIVTPSESAKEIVASYYPDLKEKIQVIEHGTEKPEGMFRNVPKWKKEFNVAFLGAINVAKGFDVAKKLIASEKNDVNWYLFGYFERKLSEYQDRKNFHDLGPYKREELPGLVKKHGINLICILPKWPETYCYTVSEAIQAGVPVLVTDIGALGERVRRLDCGWVVPADATAEDIQKKIKEISGNKSEYEQKVKNLVQLELKSVEEMCREYVELYQREFARGNEYHYEAFDNKTLLYAYLLNEGADTPYANLSVKLNEARRQLEDIQTCYSYRLALKLRRIPIPFREPLKRFSVRLYHLLRRE